MIPCQGISSSSIQSAIFGNILAPLGYRPLEVNGAAHRFDGAREFCHESGPLPS